MDRRQQKTRQAISDALSRLLGEKQYNHITVQEIIEEANIGRSTFYAHFETKDELLNTMCRDIFEHVFSDTLKTEKTHDFSHNQDDLDTILKHILFHFWDKKEDIKRILKSQSSTIFIGYLDEYMGKTYRKYQSFLRKDIPETFSYSILEGSFSDTLKWWLIKHPEYSPDEVADYYLKFVGSVFTYKK